MVTFASNRLLFGIARVRAALPVGCDKGEVIGRYGDA